MPLIYLALILISKVKQEKIPAKLKAEIYKLLINFFHFPYFKEA